MYDFRPKVNVCVTQTNETYACATEESLLRGMLRLGRKGIPVGCVNGGCGVCKVRVLEGRTTPLGPISRAHVTAEEEGSGYTLACRVAPATAVRLEVAAKLCKPFNRPPAGARFSCPDVPAAAPPVAPVSLPTPPNP